MERKAEPRKEEISKVSLCEEGRFMSNLDFEYFEQMKEQRHRASAERLIFSKLGKVAQNKAVIAIDDLMKEDERITWEWVDTALKKKAPSNWEEYGFGLFFNPRFQASVYQAIERNEKAERGEDPRAAFEKIGNCGSRSSIRNEGLSSTSNNNYSIIESTKEQVSDEDWLTEEGTPF